MEQESKSIETIKASRREANGCLSNDLKIVSEFIKSGINIYNDIKPGDDKFDKYCDLRKIVVSINIYADHDLILEIEGNDFDLDLCFDKLPVDIKKLGELFIKFLEIRDRGFIKATENELIELTENEFLENEEIMNLLPKPELDSTEYRCISCNGKIHFYYHGKLKFLKCNNCGIIHKNE